MGLHSTGGRNFLGRVCVHHKGGALKRRYLMIDRFRRLNQCGFILKTLRDRFKAPLVGMLLYDNGLVGFVTLSSGAFAGLRLYSGERLPHKLGLVDSTFSVEGSSNLLRHIGLFTVVNSLELFPWSGFKLARAAGASAFMVGKAAGKILIKLNSGWQLKIPDGSMAVLGMHSQFMWSRTVIGKAGKNRALGIRPAVRGVIKNPCDHPHGGGEGRGSPPAAPVTP